MGAIRSLFWDDYHLLRPTDPKRRKPDEIVDKYGCCPSHPVHYTSTAGVVSGESDAAASIEEQSPARDGSNGYVASRCACERILEWAPSRLGMPVSIQ